MRYTAGMELETIGAGEVEEVLSALAAAFLEDLDEGEAALDAKIVEPERTLATRQAQLELRTREARLQPDVERTRGPAVMPAADARARIARARELIAADGLWVRLVDLPRALRERTYSAPLDTVLEISDEVCPWNAGQLRLAWDGSSATCEPTGAAPDVKLSAAELGAAYLGGTTLASLAAAGRVRERSAGALDAASVAFGGTVQPWCPEIF
jgi:Sterol carrier protein domain